ncbi:hypothetical protein [Candidatus Spongiihabitans sp.]|uniref:hypothetical protein n=1 Tax=Candidatus Spongiihabitans sp. TaxID=3101308 RepID=UPI003C7D2911
MKVKELIKLLENHESDKQVVIRGYEDGYNDILKIRNLRIIPHRDQKESHNGEYDEAYKKEAIKVSTPAIELWGDNTKAEWM